MEQRDESINISHRKMPTWWEHKKFVKSNPYKVWYSVSMGKSRVGAIYLTHANEIGIFILKKFQGLGLAQKAIKALMEELPQERYLANINPSNERSIGLFTKLGFKHIQNTYELRPDWGKFNTITEEEEK